MKPIFIIVLLLFVFKNGKAQQALEIKKAKALFEGAWVNKKANRHLTIFIEDDGYVTINDWIGSKRTASIDAYKAYIKRGKLIMPAETEHHAPYSEMHIKGNKLIYMTESEDLMNKKVIENVFFVRSEW
jgi:hypothetical protein